MTIRPRAVKALRDVRERLRDAAAASHATAIDHRESSTRALRDEHTRHDEFLAAASTHLAAAANVYDLDRVADDVGLHRLAIADATARESAAIAITDATAGALRERTRQLRSAEKLVEKLDDHRTKQEARAEQRGHDDLAAVRR